MDNKLRLLSILADGKFHSGEDIGKQMGISRSAIWKMIKKLGNLGIDIQSITGRGYRIVDGIERLSKSEITAHINPAAQAHVADIEIFDVIDSTNSYLMNKAADPQLQSGTICLAEYQSNGRGRQGRQWLSPYGATLPLSILWKFSGGPGALVGLSLTIGIIMTETLKSLGFNDIQLKWPNDVLWRGKKLAGILVEMFIDDLGLCNAVMGIGLNVSLPRDLSQSISQPWTDLKEISGRVFSRNQLVGVLINNLLLALPIFEEQGFQPFIEKWQPLDAMLDKSIVLKTPNQSQIIGKALGINEMGGLKIETPTGIQVFHAGEVTVAQSGI